MSYTLGEAAKATGKSKPTIQRAIKNGRIFAKKNENGRYAIDPAELHRVFKPVTDDGNEGGTLKQPESPSDTRMLQREIELLREQLSQEHETVSDLRRRLDETEDERRRTAEQFMGLLTHQQESKPPQKPPQGRLAKAWAALTGKL